MFDYQIRQSLPVKSVPVYIKEIIQSLDNIQPGTDTNITNAIHSIADKIKRRGLIIIISDLLDDPEKVLSGIKHLKYNKHEIIVFHIVDDMEIDFDFKGEFIFEDLESNQKIKTDSRYVQQEYLKQFNKHCEFYKSRLYESYVDYNILRTSESVETALTQYLLRRQNLY